MLLLRHPHNEVFVGFLELLATSPSSSNLLVRVRRGHRASYLTPFVGALCRRAEEEKELVLLEAQRAVSNLDQQAARLDAAAAAMLAEARADTAEPPAVQYELQRAAAAAVKSRAAAAGTAAMYQARAAQLRAIRGSLHAVRDSMSAQEGGQEEDALGRLTEEGLDAFIEAEYGEQLNEQSDEE